MSPIRRLRSNAFKAERATERRSTETNQKSPLLGTQRFTQRTHGRRSIPGSAEAFDKGLWLDTEDGVGAARERLAEMHNHDLPQQLQAVQTENRQIDGPGGPIPIRTYRADQAASEHFP